MITVESMRAAASVSEESERAFRLSGIFSNLIPIRTRNWEDLTNKELRSTLELRPRGELRSTLELCPRGELRSTFELRPRGEVRSTF